jgi:hypothetical protein
MRIMCAAETAAAVALIVKEGAIDKKHIVLLSRDFCGPAEPFKSLCGGSLGIKISNGDPLPGLPDCLVQQNTKRGFAHATFFLAITAICIPA